MWRGNSFHQLLSTWAVATGKMAVKILTGEANVSEMPIEYAPEFTKKYNPELAEAMGVTIPDDYASN